MQASFYIIVRNGSSMSFSIRGSSAWWSCARMVYVTALDIQVSLRNPLAMLEDCMTLVKTLYSVRYPTVMSQHFIVMETGSTQ